MQRQFTCWFNCDTLTPMSIRACHMCKIFLSGDKLWMTPWQRQFWKGVEARRSLTLCYWKISISIISIYIYIYIYTYIHTHIHIYLCSEVMKTIQYAHPHHHNGFVATCWLWMASLTKLLAYCLLSTLLVLTLTMHELHHWLSIAGMSP